MGTLAPGRPRGDEAAPYYWKYIDRVAGEDVVGVLAEQEGRAMAWLGTISEERSLHRYEPGKWTLRELLSHVSDAERVFVSRAFWFARGFTSALPDYDQDVCSRAARANDLAWSRHLEDFKAVRGASLTFFRGLPAEAWSRTGLASGNPFTVRSLAFIVAGHLEHHLAIARERYAEAPL